MAAPPKSSSPALFKCRESNCRSTCFATKPNLMRHIRSKHGPKVRMPCGEERQNHTSNKKRHQRNCNRCKAIAAQQMDFISATGNQEISTVDVTTFNSGAATSERRPQSYAAELNHDLFDVFCWTSDSCSLIHPGEQWNSELPCRTISYLILP